MRSDSISSSCASTILSCAIVFPVELMGLKTIRTRILIPYARATKRDTVSKVVIRGNKMYRRVTISAVYGLPSTWEKFDASCEELGWNKKTFLTQLLHSFGSRYIDYYREAAELDAIARGFESHCGDYYDLLSNWGDLPKYVQVQPPFTPSPLAEIPDIPTGKENRRTFSYISCSGANSAILRIATIVERSSPPQTISRIMEWHYGEYWGKGYLRQIESDRQRRLDPVF